jgi:MATE family multidrug resistance protein
VLSELKPLLKIAAPIVLGEIGWMAMGIVDTLMVGPLGPAAIGATGIGSSLFFAIATFAIGLMLGVDTLVAQAYGAKRLDECLRWFHHGLALAVAVTPAVMLTTWGLALTIGWWGLHPDIGPLAGRYLAITTLGTFPLMLYASVRRYLHGLHIVGPMVAALLSANLVNAAGNWVLIYGNLGMPALGVEGSAWATVAARVYMAVFVGIAVIGIHRRRGAAHPRVPVAIERARIKRLVGLGFPAASQIALEVGAFATSTTLAGKLDPVASASHQIALNIASLAFMVPLGLASASAVRVGHAVGAGDVRRTIVAGWTAFATGACLMVVTGTVMLAWREAIVRAFTGDGRVIEIGMSLLVIGAAFQVVDGTQAVATGVLRGIGETRMPMYMNVIGHWMLGLPAGYVLCFVFGWGVRGLWFGLATGLTFAAVTLTAVWARRARQMAT